MTSTWKTLDIKQKIAIITAIMAFILGWCLTFCGFLVPPIGEVADSILWILGQALIYAASVFGVTSYFTSESIKLRNDINRQIANFEKSKLRTEDTYEE